MTKQADSLTETARDRPASSQLGDPSGFTLAQVSFEHFGNEGDTFCVEVGAVGPTDRPGVIGPDAALVPHPEDVEPLLEFEVDDAGRIHMKEGPADEKRDRLYVLGSSLREGRGWPFPKSNDAM